ncbi:unnamed protein product [Menidia menidia]|uniref:(Atlantic silverside) hypothetical protein n=1 Tax=Menidia menidia TaxID=238744 RepID=A0A8S4B427_9TELE|nr:unnamed protein product [Menidia menidia]
MLNLKREFQHHKDKIHEYNLLMDTVSRTEEFREPRVIELWESAKRANLSRDELDSLKVETLFIKEKNRDSSALFFSNYSVADRSAHRNLQGK